MRKILFVIFFSTSFTAQAQLRPHGSLGNKPTSANNRSYYNSDLPVVVDKYPRFASGNPYFLEEWINGDIELDNGETYKNIALRLDLVENTLQYKNSDGMELIASAQVKTVILKDSAGGNEYRFVYSSFLQGAENIEPGWYQVLVSGPACLYKHIVKTVMQPKNYSSSETEPSVNTTEEYFIYTDSVLSHVKKIKDIPSLLKSKTNELEKYMNDKKLTGRSASNYIELVRYYNSLVIK